MEPTNDLEGFRRAVEQLRSSLREADAAGDFELARAAVQAWESSVSVEQAARAWLTLSEDWAARAPAGAHQALQAACRLATRDRTFYARLQTAFSETGNHEASSMLAQMADTGADISHDDDTPLPVPMADPTPAAPVLDLRQQLRVADEAFRAALEDPTADLAAACHEVSLLSLTVSRDLDIALGYVHEAWSAEHGDRRRLFATAESLADQSHPAPHTLALLTTLAREAGGWAAIVRWQRATLKSESDPSQQSQAWLRIGEAYGELHNPPAAIDAYRSAADVDPAIAEAAARGIADLATSSRPGMLNHGTAPTLVWAASQLSDSARASALWILAADLFENVGNKLQALSAVESALAIQDSAALRERREKLLEATGRVDELLRALESDGAGALDPERLNRRIELLSGANRFDEALVDAATLRDAGDAQPLQKLFANPEAAAFVPEAALELARRGGAEAAPLFLHAAALQLGLDAPAGAEFYLRALEFGSSNPALWENVDPAGFAAAPGLRERFLHALADGSPDAAQALNARVEIARGLVENEPLAAFEQIQQVLAADAAHADALQLQVQCARELGDLPFLAAALEANLGTPPSATGLEELTLLYAGPLDLPDQAFDAARRLLSMDPDNRPAKEFIRNYAARKGDQKLHYDTLLASRDDLQGVARAYREAELATLAFEMSESAPGFAHLSAAWAETEVPTAERASWARAAFEVALCERHLEEAQTNAQRLMEAGESTDRWLLAEELVDRLGELSATSALSLARSFDNDEAPAPFLDRLAQLSFMQGDDPAGIQALERWNHLEDAPLPQDRQLQLAAAHSRCEQFEPAAALIGALLANDPNQPEALAQADGEDLRAPVGRLLLSHADQRSDADEARALRERAADLAMPAHPDLAAAAWEAILRATPADLETLAKLRQVLQARGDETQEAHWIEQALPHLDEDDALPLLQALGELSGDDAVREKRFLAILEADLSDVPSRLSLADIYLRTDRATQAAETLEEAVDFADDRIAVTLLQQASKIYRETLNDRRGEERTLYALAEADPSGTAALERLVELHQSAEEWDKAAAALDRLAKRQDGDARTTSLQQAASLREDSLGDREGALANFENILKEEPYNIPVLQEIARIHEESENWEKLIETFDRTAQAAPIPELQRELLVRGAPVLATRLDRVADAIAVLGRAFDISPASDEELDLMESIVARNGAWLTLAGATRAAAESESDPARKEALEVRTAQILAGKAGEVETAISWLAERFVSAPARGTRLETLEALAAEHQQEKLLIEAYKALASSAEEDGDDETYWHAMSSSARIALERLQHPEVAFGIYRKVAEKPALRADAEEQMEQLAERFAQWALFRDYLANDLSGDSLENQLRLAAIEDKRLDNWQAAFETLLNVYAEAPFDERVREPLYALAEAHRGWSFIAKLLETLQEDAARNDKTRLISEIARIFGDHQGRPADAFEQQLRAWQIAPDEPELQALLEQRALAADRQIDLLAAWEWRTRQPGNTEELATAFDRAAELAIQLGSPDRAVALFTRQASANAGAAAPQVFAAARASLEASALPGEVVSLALSIGRASIATAPRLEILLTGAELAADLLDHSGEIACLQEALTLSREPATIRPQLAAAYRKAEDRDALVQTLEQMFPESGADEQIALTRELVSLNEDDPARALAAARRLYDAQSAVPQARELLVSTLRAQERWSDLIDLYEREAGRATDADTALNLRLEAAQLAEEHLGDIRRATRFADQILEADPGNRRALELRANGLAAEGKWGAHLEALLQLADSSQGAEASAFYAQAAHVEEAQLANSEQAIELWKKAANADPAYTVALEELARLYAEQGDYDSATEAIDQAVILVRSGSPIALSEVLTTSAMLESQRGETDQAIAKLNEALEANPRNARALGEIEFLLLDQNQATALLDVFDSALASTPDDRSRADLLRRRARVAFFELDQDVDAIKAIQRAGELSNPRQSHALLGDIHLVKGRWADSASAYDAAFDGGETLQDVVGELRPLMPGESDDLKALDWTYLCRAAYAHEAAGHIAKAQDYYAAANLNDENYGPALVGLARLALRRGQPEGARIYIDSYHSIGGFETALNEQMAAVEQALAAALR